jgi:hypothetical protein
MAVRLIYIWPVHSSEMHGKVLQDVEVISSVMTTLGPACIMKHINIHAGKNSLLNSSTSKDFTKPAEKT